MATNFFYGLQTRWATNGISCTSWGSSLVQGADVDSSMAGVSTHPNQLGNTAIVNLFDPTKEASITIIPTSGATADGNLITSGLMPVRGTTIVITDSIDSNALIVGTNWKVLSVAPRRTSSGVEEYVLRVKAWDGIA